MKTQTKIRLINPVDEEETLNVNKELLSLGYRDPTDRGPFYAMKYLLADTEDIVKYMNTDPRGLKEREDLKRPITLEQFTKEYTYWLTIGYFCTEISCLNKEEKCNLRIVMQWAWRNKEKIDGIRSKYWTEKDALDYDIFSADEIASM